jgi:DNA topoisomerase-1
LKEGTFPGHTAVYGERTGEQQLPELKEGQQLQPARIVASQNFTRPPRRYTEATLVKALEENGIGRPSTYASILSTIVDRKYVDHGEEAEQERLRQQRNEATPAGADEDEEDLQTEEELEEAASGPRRRRKSHFHATHLGEVTTDLLEPQFGDIVNTDFTAAFESHLDQIAEGGRPWQEVVAEFYERFHTDLEAARDGMDHYRSRPLTVPDLTCDRVAEEGGEPCGAPMVVLFNRGGTYLGCSRYPECSNNLPLSGMRVANAEPTDHKCRARDEAGQVCGRPMEKKVNRWGRPFLACTGYATGDCKGAVSLSTKGEPLWPVETSVPCPTCGRMLAVKRSRRGKFLACPGYPKCRGTLNLPACPHESRTGKVCGAPMTEPGPDGTMRCREHTDCALPPPPPRAAKEDDQDAAPAAATTRRKAKATRKAKRKTARKTKRG